MLVYVINKNGNRLMPCKPAKARKLLREGKAKVAEQSPFTIQLSWDCEENIQDVTVGIDKGSHVSGFSCVGNGEVLMCGEIHHRTDIKGKMEGRRANRRQRRSRKWYRSPRFDNRSSSQRSGRLPPSVKANADEIIRVVERLSLPISRIVIEDVQVDIARLNNPALIARAYQETTRLDENLRLATLMRDGFQCQSCHKKNARLEAHHIIYRKYGGKDTLDNLVTLCTRCHRRVHQDKLVLEINGASAFQDRIAQRTMQGKSYMYQQLEKIAPLSTLFGYQTAAFRKQLGLEKTHDTDALCVATLQTEEEVSPQRDNFFTIKFRPRQTRRQYHDLPRKNQGRVRYQVNFQLEGFRKGDIVRVKEKHIKQINSIYSNGYLAFARIPGTPTAAKPKDCQLLRRQQTILWQRIL